MTVIELRNKRAQKLAAARAFLESNRTPDGFLSQENDAVYTAMENDIANLGKEISRMERLEAMDAELSRPLTSPLTEKPAAVAKTDERRDARPTNTARHSGTRPAARIPSPPK